MITTNEMPMNITKLKAIPVIKPERFTDRWQGIQHGELVEIIHGQLDIRGVKIKDENWFPSGQELQSLQGSMQLTIPNVTPMEGMDFSLGVQHSNTGRHALKFAVGAKIFICSNGMVVGDYAVKRKHTIGLDLMESIGIGIDTYINKVKDIPLIAQTMKETEMSTSDVDRTLMQAGREGLMSWSRIGQADEEYRKPTFAELEEKTAWGLYNAFTYTIQKMPAQYHLKSMNRFREILIGDVTQAAA
jgi:hypothetical protein